MRSKADETFVTVEKTFDLTLDQPVSVAAKDIAIALDGLGFDSWTGQIGCNVTTSSLVQQCFLRAVLPRCYAAEMGPPPITCFNVMP